MLSLTQTISIFIKRCRNIFATPLNYICAGSLYLGPFAIIERTCKSEMIFRLPVITWPEAGYTCFYKPYSLKSQGNKFDIMTRNKFIEIKYSASNKLTVFITHDWYFTILIAGRPKAAILF